MAWLYKQPESKYWWIGWRVGKRQFLKSTKQEDEGEAKKVLARFEAMEAARRAERLNEDFYKSLTGKALPIVSVKTALADWLDECRRTTAANTFARYEDIAQQFTAYLKADDSHPLVREIDTAAVTGFLNAAAKTLAGSSVNLSRKILTTFFNRAVANGQVDNNPVKGTKRDQRKRKTAARRAFEVKEVRDLLTKASAFWRYMITGGLYSGLRMGDLICVRRDEVNLERNTLRMIMGKTGDTVEIPLAPPFQTVIVARLKELGKIKPTDYLWPEQAARYIANGSGAFSNEFYEDVLQPCGLVPARTKKHKATKQGRGVKRELNAVSFHSLRHTFISLLKTSGASQAVAKELAGHSSDAVSDLYTHVSLEHMKQAIALLPEVTNAAA